MFTAVYLRRDTFKNWWAANPMLTLGEVGLVFREANNGKGLNTVDSSSVCLGYVVGDGFHYFRDLKIYVNDSVTRKSGEVDLGETSVDCYTVNGDKVTYSQKTGKVNLTSNDYLFASLGIGGLSKGSGAKNYFSELYIVTKEQERNAGNATDYSEITGAGYAMKLVADSDNTANRIELKASKTDNGQFNLLRLSSGLYTGGSVCVGGSGYLQVVNGNVIAMSNNQKVELQPSQNKLYFEYIDGNKVNHNYSLTFDKNKTVTASSSDANGNFAVNGNVSINGDSLSIKDSGNRFLKLETSAGSSSTEPSLVFGTTGTGAKNVRISYDKQYTLKFSNNLYADGEIATKSNVVSRTTDSSGKATSYVSLKPNGAVDFNGNSQLMYGNEWLECSTRFHASGDIRAFDKSNGNWVHIRPSSADDNKRPQVIFGNSERNLALEWSKWYSLICQGTFIVQKDLIAHGIISADYTASDNTVHKVELQPKDKKVYYEKKPSSGTPSSYSLTFNGSDTLTASNKFTSSKKLTVSADGAAITGDTKVTGTFTGTSTGTFGNSLSVTGVVKATGKASNGNTHTVELHPIDNMLKYTQGSKVAELKYNGDQKLTSTAYLYKS